MYGKATHTNPYLNARSHPHSSYEISVLSTLAHRDTAICDRTVSAALDTLQSVFPYNGFSPKETEWFLYPPQPIRKPRDMAITYLPLVQNTFNSISRVLSKHISRPLAHHVEKFREYVSSKTARVPNLQDSECGEVYTWQTGGFMETRTTPTIDVSGGGTQQWPRLQGLAQ